VSEVNKVKNGRRTDIQTDSQVEWIRHSGFSKQREASAGFIGSQIYEWMREERANDCHTNWMRLFGRTLGMQLHMQAIGTLLEPKFRSAA